MTPAAVPEGGVERLAGLTPAPLSTSVRRPFIKAARASTEESGGLCSISWHDGAGEERGGQRLRNRLSLSTAGCTHW